MTSLDVIWPKPISIKKSKWIFILKYWTKVIFLVMEEPFTQTDSVNLSSFLFCFDSRKIIQMLFDQNVRSAKHTFKISFFVSINVCILIIKIAKYLQITCLRFYGESYCFYEFGFCMRFDWKSESNNIRIYFFPFFSLVVTFWYFSCKMCTQHPVFILWET